MILNGIALTLHSGPWLPAADGTAGPFLTLAAVIVAGAVADWVGVFRLLARGLVPERASGRIAFALVLSMTAIISGGVNLDVAVVVVMPLALRVAHRRRLSASGLAVATAIAANATSFLLPTSNLTNLLVLQATPLSVSAYLRDSWVAWVLVTLVTIMALALLLGQVSRSESPTEPRSAGVIGTLVDLIPMFLLATAIRTLLIGGLTLPGGFIEQFLAGSLLAGAVNNLPASAAVHAVGATSQWAAISAMAMGPNIFLTGSVATLICRRIARDHGVSLPLVAYSVVGISLLPLQVLAAVIGFKLTGAF